MCVDGFPLERNSPDCFRATMTDRPECLFLNRTENGQIERCKGGLRRGMAATRRQFRQQLPLSRFIHPRLGV